MKMTKLTLTRINYTSTYTLGFIRYEDFFCFTLEPVKKEVHGCIPLGVYPIVWEWSEKFQDQLCELKKVPGRSEIKIHAGNSANDTTGCILVGTGFATSMQYLSDSLKALTKFDKLNHDQKITEIEVREV